MPGFEVVEDGFGGFLMGECVAENLVIDSLVECFEDLGCRAEVHIRDPKGEDVAVCVAVPFETASVCTVGKGGEIVVHEVKLSVL